MLGHQWDHVKSAKQAAWLLRHVFTAVARTDTGPRWSVVVLDYGHARAVVEGHAPPQANCGRYLKPVSAYVSTAKSALDRIVIPQEVLDRIASTASPRSSLIISDEALSAESGKARNSWPSSVTKSATVCRRRVSVAIRLWKFHGA